MIRCFSFICNTNVINRNILHIYFACILFVWCLEFSFNMAGRDVVFTDRNGVSLSGEVCLNHTDVPQVWLQVGVWAL